MYRRFSKHCAIRSVPFLLVGRSFLAPKANQEARRPDKPGFVVEYIGDTYLVQHEKANVLAVYEECELLEEPNAYWTVTYPVAGIMYFKEFATYDETREFVQDELGGVATTEGPFYSDKELQEGVLDTKTLFDHLTDDI